MILVAGRLIVIFLTKPSRSFAYVLQHSWANFGGMLGSTRDNDRGKKIGLSSTETKELYRSANRQIQVVACARPSNASLASINKELRV